MSFLKLAERMLMLALLAIAMPTGAYAAEEPTLVGPVMIGFSLQAAADEQQLPSGGGLPPLTDSSVGLARPGTLPPIDDSDLSLPTDPRADVLVPRERRGRRSLGPAMRGTTVLARKRPSYDPVGVRVGGFTLFPSLSTGAGGTTRAASRKGTEDVFATIAGRVRLESNWSKHELVLNGAVNRQRYVTYSSQNATGWLAEARGRIDISREDTLRLEASSERVVESRGAVGEIARATHPITYTRTSTGVDWNAVRGRLTSAVSFDYQSDNYIGSTDIGGVRFDEDQRDNKRYAGSVQIGYRFLGGQNLFVSASQTAQKYSENQLRNLQETQILAGIQSEITPLIRGRFSLGYLNINFDSSRFKSRSALAVDVNLDYLITELTTLHLRGRRYTKSVTSATAPTALVTSFTFSADHELRRNLILSGSVTAQVADYVGTQRKDELVGADLSANWFISRRWRASARIGVLHRTNRGNLNELDDDRFGAVTGTLGVTLQL